MTANRLEVAVWLRVARLLSQPDLVLEEARRHREGRVGERDEMLMRVDYVRAALAKLPAERERVQTMYREGYLELDGLRAQLGAAERKRAALDEERRALEARLKAVTADEAQQGRLEEVTARLAGRLFQLTDAERYEIVHAFIERITISLDGTVDLRAYVPAGRLARRSYVRTAWAVPGPLK